jgi:lipopolysaccharide/colanic/teichoic acid biosynthesis glycosyltransferase
MHHDLKKMQEFLKYQMDLSVSLISLVLLSPFFVVIAIAIKLNSKGPVFFGQERVGKDGKIFTVWKLRTMVEGAIDKGLGYNVAKGDNRITRIGGFLRAWGLDELPQLINVLRGEMSIVGPRPTLKYQVDQYNDFQNKRLLVKPGITGWALIHGRNSLSWEERIKYDIWYVENRSLWLDIRIILKTLWVVLIKQEGVYGRNGINDEFIASIRKVEGVK